MFKNFLNKLKKNRRGYFSLLIFVTLFCLTLFAEIIANDKPLMVGFEGKVYFPAFKSYSETDFGGVFETEADYRDKAVQELIRREGWMIFAPIPFSYNTINCQVKTPAPSKPSSQNLLGTDDNGRDVLARIIYGVRISLVFGLILTFFTVVIGIFMGAIQGYFGGLLDLALQRFMEIWSSMPTLFLLIILYL